MHILIAPDSFKESLTAQEVAQALKLGFHQALPHATFDLMPLGDGGEGTVVALADNLGLPSQTVVLEHAYAQDGLVHYASDGKRAIFEMAEICGIEKVDLTDRNPLHLSTRGVGEMISHLIRQGHSEIIIGVGGSATNDGGIGMASALGYHFYDETGQELEAIGANLGRIKRVDRTLALDTAQVKVRIISDVTNPLCGPNGATYVFGPQKGLDKGDLAQVDQMMKEFYQSFAPAMLEKSGAGAGGGMAAGLMAFVGADIVSGIDYVLDQVAFDSRVQKADLVIVGEGRLDAQSLSGKVPIGVAKRTPSNIPVLAICGSLKNDLPDFPVAGIRVAFPIISKVASLEETLAEAHDNLRRTALNIGNLLSLGENS